MAELVTLSAEDVLASIAPFTTFDGTRRRVEGTLFGNGERTGNLDVVNVAMNLFANSVDPELDVGDIDALRRVAEYCNRLPVYPRHPYAGDLVFTSFSGSHQDAINMGFEALPADYRLWGVPYLPIDPKHVGRSYEAVIRVNSQSGKGGVAYVMKAEYGFDLPRRLQIEFSKTIQHITEDSGTEIGPGIMWDAFQDAYLPEAPRFVLDSHELRSDSTSGNRSITAQLVVDGQRVTVQGQGNGPIDAFVQAIRTGIGADLDVVDYQEHAVGQGSQATATAIAYVEACHNDGSALWGVGSDPNIITAALRAVLGVVTAAASRDDRDPAGKRSRHRANFRIPIDHTLGQVLGAGRSARRYWST